MVNAQPETSKCGTSMFFSNLLLAGGLLSASILSAKAVMLQPSSESFFFILAALIVWAGCVVHVRRRIKKGDAKGAPHDS